MKTNIYLDKDLWSMACKVDVRAKPVERYIEMAFTQAFRAAMKGLHQTLPNNEKKVLSERLHAELRHYAKWITVDLTPNKEGVAYTTNLSTIFKTTKGMWYGHHPGPLRQLFYSTHCLERFIERSKDSQYKHVIQCYFDRYGRAPNPVEVIDYLILDNWQDLEFGLVPSTEVYLNIGIGILVLDSYDDVYCAKTFLLPSYNVDASWYKLDNTNPNVNIKERLCQYAVPCNPTFKKGAR